MQKESAEVPEEQSSVPRASAETISEGSLFSLNNLRTCGSLDEPVGISFFSRNNCWFRRLPNRIPLAFLRQRIEAASYPSTILGDPSSIL